MSTQKYLISGERGQWRFQKDNGNHLVFWKFDNDCNRRVSVVIAKDQVEEKVMQKVMQHINLSTLESLRGE